MEYSPFDDDSIAEANLVTAQAGITAAFLHAELPIREYTYVHQAQGFRRDGDNGEEYVNKLNRSLYGLKQAPQHFFHYLKERLEKHRVMKSDLDPCLFIGKKVIALVHK